MRFISFFGFCWLMALLGMGLGIWQMARLQEKQALLSDIAERQQAPPIQLDFADAASLPPYTPVKISGRLDATEDEVFLLLNRVQDGKVGRGLMQVLHSPQGSVLVDRGWVAADYRAEAETVSISGILRQAPRVGFFTPSNRPQKGEWYYIDIIEISRIAGIAERDFYISTDSDFWRRIPNNHLQYAFTWFSLAILFFVMPFFARKFLSNK